MYKKTGYTSYLFEYHDIYYQYHNKLLANVIITKRKKFGSGLLASWQAREK
jgi:hypothetical protein